MNITISENLKAFRREKNNTQEELAAFLNVSIAAVSKWERGECYPDTELMPKIALFYGVTLDDLFGMNEAKISERIGEYMARYNESWVKEADVDERAEKNVALWREAQKEFPNNHTVLYQLMNSLNFPYWKPSDNFDEIIQIGERLLAESTDNEIRNNTIWVLNSVCASKKDIENAKRYATMMPSYMFCNEILFGNCLYGDERLTYRQYCIKEFIRTIYVSFIQDMFNTAGAEKKCDLPEGYVLKMCEFALNLFKLLYPDGDYGEDERWVAVICNVLTNQYSGDDNEKALYYLEETVNHYVRYYTQGEFKHTSFTVDRLTCHGFTESKDFMRRCVTQDLSVIEGVPDLEPIRGDTRYAAAVAKLKVLLK